MWCALRADLGGREGMREWILCVKILLLNPSRKRFIGEEPKLTERSRGIERDCSWGPQPRVLTLNRAYSGAGRQNNKRVSLKF